MSGADGGAGNRAFCDFEKILSCPDLERMELWDTNRCCGACHLPERFMDPRLSSTGPCTIVLGDARLARCCCAAKKSAGGRASAASGPSTLEGGRGVVGRNGPRREAKPRRSHVAAV